jgi:hypothetical protein
VTGRRWLVVGLVGGAAVVAGVGVVAWWRLSQTSTAVPVGAAVQKFDQQTTTGVTGPPTPGVYTYAVRGQECAGIAGLMLCRSFPAHARMILTRTPGTITIELDLSQQHLETQRYTLRRDGRYLAWQRVRIVFGVAQDDARNTEPATLALPAVLRVGQHWTQRFSVGDLVSTSTNTVTRRVTIPIGGVRVATYEIDASSTTTGPHPGTETDLTLHDPRDGLDVRLVVHRRIGGTFPYTMDVDATLLSTVPVR